MPTLQEQFNSDAAAIIEEIGITVVFDFEVETREVKAIFTDGYQQGMVAEVGIAGSNPMLLVMTARIADRIEPGEIDESGTTVTVNGEQYRVTNHKPDGAGKSMLMLTRGR